MKISFALLCVSLATAQVHGEKSFTSFKRNSKLPVASVKTSKAVTLIGSTSNADDIVTAESNWKGNACIIGGALAHLTFGTMYCWGNFLSYAPDHLKFFDGKLHPGVQPDALYVMPLTIVTQAIAMPWGPAISKRIGLSNTLLLGSWITALSVYLASYQTKLARFIAFYSLMFGAGIGISYTAPMAAGWKWKPLNKGLVSGGILAGFGSGGFIFSLIGSSHVNPLKLNAINGRFPESVYQAFPSMLRKLAVIYAVVSTVGSLMIFEKDESVTAAAVPVVVMEKYNPADKTKSTVPLVLKSDTNMTPSGLSVSQALSTSQFWLMWLMIVSSATAGLNTANVYKLFASSSAALAGDSYQIMVGGVGAIINGLGRIVWGIISDKIGFKQSFMLVTLMQMVGMLTYPFSVHSKAAFALNTSLLFFCLAGNFALMPPATQKMFGAQNGAVIYGIIFSAFAVASLLSGKLTQVLSLTVGWKGVFGVLAGMSLFATLLGSQLKPVKDYKDSSV